MITGRRVGGACALLLLGSNATRLAAQRAPAGSTPQDSVRAVEIARGQALLEADTIAEFVEISRPGRRAVAMQQTSMP